MNSSDDDDFEPIEDPFEPEADNLAGANGKRIGKGNPPKANQFKKGQPSANPKGRPKGSRKENPITKILKRRIPIIENGRKRMVTVDEALAIKFVDLALKGDPRFAQLLMKLQFEIAKHREAMGPTAEEILKKREEDARRKELTEQFTKDVNYYMDWSQEASNDPFYVEGPDGYPQITDFGSCIRSIIPDRFYHGPVMPETQAIHDALDARFGEKWRPPSLIDRRVDPGWRNHGRHNPDLPNFTGGRQGRRER